MTVAKPGESGILIVGGGQQPVSDQPHTVVSVKYDPWGVGLDALRGIILAAVATPMHKRLGGASFMLVLRDPTTQTAGPEQYIASVGAGEDSSRYRAAAEAAAYVYESTGMGIATVARRSPLRLRKGTITTGHAAICEDVIAGGAGSSDNAGELTGYILGLLVGALNTAVGKELEPPAA